MKVLFLDIDGVVNRVGTRQRYRGFMGIDPVLAFKVRKIILDTDAALFLRPHGGTSKAALKKSTDTSTRPLTLLRQQTQVFVARR